MEQVQIVLFFGAPENKRGTEPLCDRSGKSGLWIDDPVTVAVYARDNGLLDEPGWKLPGLKKIAKTQKKLIHMANKAKLHSFCSKPIYMCGFQVPCNHTAALELDRVNGNNMWIDAETTELNQIKEHKSFIDKGVGHNPGSDCKRIRVHMACAVKHDGRHKARSVAGGHLTETPIESACSSVVSLRGARLLAFIGALNGLKIWSTLLDLEAVTVLSVATHMPTLGIEMRWNCWKKEGVACALVEWLGDMSAVVQSVFHNTTGRP